MFLKYQDDTFSTHQLKAFYDLEYNTLLLLELLFAIAMHAAFKSFKRSKEQGKPKRYSDLAMPLAYAICSAIVGTQSVVNAKCLSELLTLTFQGDNQMVRGEERRGEERREQERKSALHRGCTAFWGG